MGRGFDTSVGYLSGSERHFSHLKGAEQCHAGPNNCSGTCATDFWHTSAPATGYDNEYSATVYGSETVKVVEANAKAGAGVKPFFVYLAFANTHEPLEAPPQYQALYPPTLQPRSRMLLGAMVSAMDEAVGNITDALKATKLWENTLLVWVADNGGPTGVGDIVHPGMCAANNFPLRERWDTCSDACPAARASFLSCSEMLLSLCT